MMKYKGYTGSVEYDPGDRIFHGRIQGITADIVTFEGTSVDELEQDFKESVDDYLAGCTEDGIEPQRPYSGRFVLRLPPDIHGEVTAAARMAKTSMNSWIVETIKARLAREKPAAIRHDDEASLSEAAGG
jgi:predicted HicB family RNase H-like nuclease